MVKEHWELFDRNTGWGGRRDRARRRMAEFLQKREKRGRDSSARRTSALSDEVLSGFAALLEATQEAGLSSIKTVAYLQASPLLSHSRFRPDATSPQAIEATIEVLSSVYLPSAAFTPGEAEILPGAHVIDPTI